MFFLNTHPDFRKTLCSADAVSLGEEAADEVQRYLVQRTGHRPTPMLSLDALARSLGISSVYVKDEGLRLGLCSFKAVGGSYAVVRLALDEAARQMGRRLEFADLHTEQLRGVAARMTFTCATDGNHGRSVAQGAELLGAKAVIFVHSGVSVERVAAIARFGAQMVRVEGTYDDSVAQAADVAAQKGWTLVSDTSWPGYEAIPALVMQGYTVIAREALDQLPAVPTHVFIQAGVGGFAAAVFGHMALALGQDRPTFVVVEPSRAACLLQTAQAGMLLKISPEEPTVMAMLECYEPSLIAWRVLSRIADAFITVEDEDAVMAMNRFARPLGNDLAIVAGESGAAGLAGLTRAIGEVRIRQALNLDAQSRVLVINTEGATDPGKYLDLVGLRPDQVAPHGLS